MLVPDLYVINVIFLAYKKKTKHEKINFQKIFVIFFLCNFSVRSLQCFHFFCPQKVEKTALKSCS